MRSARIGDRILVLGCSGSGKSTFAKRLQVCTGLPLIHLDNIWWKPDRTHISREERDAEAQRRFEMKQAKKKEKRRGH